MHRCPWCGSPCDCDEFDVEVEPGVVRDCSHDCGDDEPEDDDE